MTPVQQKRREARWAPLDLARIIRLGLAFGIATGLVWGFGYLYGTVNGWNIAQDCAAGTAIHQELC